MSTAGRILCWIPEAKAVLITLLLFFGEISLFVSGQQFANSGPIRLERNGTVSLSYTSGRIEVYVSGSQWGNICHDSSFGMTEACVVCHHLQFTGAIGFSDDSTDGFKTSQVPVVLSHVSCSSSDLLNIHQCSFSNSCPTNKRATVSCYQTKIWDNPYSGQVRLTGGDTVNQGLVEVYCNGQWGTVCAGHTINNVVEYASNLANTTCIQLGYYSSSRILIYGVRVNSSMSALPIWIDDNDRIDPLMCGISGKQCLTYCRACSNVQREECSINRGLLAIECDSSPPILRVQVTNTTCNKPETNNGPIRLWRNGKTSLSFSSGRVQIFFSEWGNICHNAGFNFNAADVICHQLGFTGATGLSNEEVDQFGSDDLPVVLSEVHCTNSSYLVILQCQYTYGSSCSSANDISVTCYNSHIWDNPYNGQVRLVLGDTVNRGIVELYCSGEWRRISDNSTGYSSFSHVVCQQLGYTHAFRTNHLPLRDNFTHSIWGRDKVECERVHYTCPTSCACISADALGSVVNDVTVECHSRLHDPVRNCIRRDHPVPPMLNTLALTIGIIVLAFLCCACVLVGGIVGMYCCHKKCEKHQGSHHQQSIPLEPTKPSIIETSPPSYHDHHLY